MIPCTPSEYKKCDTWNGTKQYWNSSTDNSLANITWSMTTPKSELTQVEKYGGFYVARYEAGLNTDRAHTSVAEFNEPIHDNETAKPQSKASLVPWNLVSFNTTINKAEEMYNNNYVSSGLITRTQWDVMISKIANKASVSLTNSTWGNCYDTSISYRGPKAIFNSEKQELSTFSGNGGTTNANELLYTGASSSCLKYGLYDVAGNLWEWCEGVYDSVVYTARRRVLYPWFKY